MAKKIFIQNKTSLSRGKDSLRIFPLGGIGNVTKNLYVYEYRNDGQLLDILLVDCGIGFPDENMFGVDLVIPDITYLQDKKDKIRGMVLSHGHDDHIGALPYILPKLPRFPVYGTKLTIAFAGLKLKEFGISASLYEIDQSQYLKLGRFEIKSIHVTHSIPDTSHLFIKTPAGNFYHGADFKFDFTPLDNRPSDLLSIAEAGKTGITCLLTDSLGSEREGYTLSEKIIEETLELEIRKTEGKFIFTTQSSNISRIQQMVDVALRHQRKVAFLGRSVEQNTDVAQKLGYLKIPREALIFDKQILRYPDNQLCLIAAGSQGQTESGLARIARGEHKYVKLRDKDVVVFSGDPIPGNEKMMHAVIDTLTQAGARVVYSETTEALHVSGHGSKQDLRLLLSLTKPHYILPIGSTYRHMIAYRNLAEEMGYARDNILLPEEGEILEFAPFARPRIVTKMEMQEVMIDGLGIGDVGEVVLRDRRTLAEEGIVVIVIPFDKNTGTVTGKPDVISRGFVYMKESAPLIEKVRAETTTQLKKKKGRLTDWHLVRRQIESNVERLLYKETGRRPLIVPVVVEV